mmetsp:Transcript_55900/g.147049  ORF Transcript_55900/g.147049 Transcript_55900/m.147049 type:complete len:239 (+) Transcript_55900:542-1258(+)
MVRVLGPLRRGQEQTSSDGCPGALGCLWHLGGVRRHPGSGGGLQHAGVLQPGRRALPEARPASALHPRGGGQVPGLHGLGGGGHLRPGNLRPRGLRPGAEHALPGEHPGQGCAHPFRGPHESVRRRARRSAADLQGLRDAASARLRVRQRPHLQRGVQRPVPASAGGRRQGRGPNSGRGVRDGRLLRAALGPLAGVRVRRVVRVGRVLRELRRGPAHPEPPGCRTAARRAGVRAARRH